MGAALGKWFAYTVLVAFMAAYLASRTLAPGTHYLQVFRVVGAVSFLTYGFGSIQMAIWMGKPFSPGRSTSSTARHVSTWFVP